MKLRHGMIVIAVATSALTSGCRVGRVLVTAVEAIQKSGDAPADDEKAPAPDRPSYERYLPPGESGAEGRGPGG